VRFIDKPAPDAPAGIWGIPISGGPAQLVTDRLGIYSPDQSLRAFPQNGQTMIERISDGQSWVIPAADGRAISFSPDGSMVAWTGGQDGPPFDTAHRQVWISDVDGSQARQVFAAVNGGLSGWFPDGRMLVSGRPNPQENIQAYFSLDPEGGVQVELARGERLRGALLSPQGSWLAYQVTFAADPQQNGLWVADTRSGERTRLELFGAYRWRDDGRLLVIPLELGKDSHQVWEITAGNFSVRQLSDPTQTRFKIASGDWSVSPDGSRMVFVSAADHNLWILDLP
jgi:dipeptidyl aminopeptidase/acylaminoacyl peptidase